MLRWTWSWRMLSRSRFFLGWVRSRVKWKRRGTNGVLMYAKLKFHRSVLRWNSVLPTFSLLHNFKVEIFFVNLSLGWLGSGVTWRRCITEKKDWQSLKTEVSSFKMFAGRFTIIFCREVTTNLNLLIFSTESKWWSFNFVEECTYATQTRAIFF